jgi:hypothetical protein
MLHEMQLHQVQMKQNYPRKIIPLQLSTPLRSEQKAIPVKMNASFSNSEAVPVKLGTSMSSPNGMPLHLNSSVNNNCFDDGDKVCRHGQVIPNSCYLQGDNPKIL